MGTKLHHKLSTALVAAIALCQAQVAHAQACLAPDDVTDAGIYAIPVVADGFRASCAPHLAADGFFATQGADFVAPSSAIGGEIGGVSASPCSAGSHKAVLESKLLAVSGSAQGYAM
ncbi:MAG: hypothetical protein VX309_13445 [Pseudomonadota bacterium]|nr:hypothetical protein [Pseudomonadota bacterium]